MDGCIIKIVVEGDSPSLQIFVVGFLVGVFVLEVDLNVFFPPLGMLMLEFDFVVLAQINELLLALLVPKHQVDLQVQDLFPGVGAVGALGMLGMGAG